jgi:hypothetical protein
VRFRMERPLLPHSGRHLGGGADHGSRAERVVGGNLDYDDPNAVGVLDPHLEQSSGLGRGFPHEGYSGCSQPGMLLADIRSWIQIISDRHGEPAACRDLKQSLAEEENHARMIRRAELPVDGQARHVAVRAEAAVQVTGRTMIRTFWARGRVDPRSLILGLGSRGIGRARTAGTAPFAQPDFGSPVSRRARTISFRPICWLVGGEAL